MAALTAALIGGAAALGGAAISGNATKNASKAASQAAAASNALQADIYHQNTSNISPFMQRGNEAGGAYNALLGLGGDPAASRAAFDQYRGSTGYDFRVGEGQNAILTNKASAGMLHSGGTLKALDRFGQSIASQEFGNYLNQLGGQQQLGLSGANALAGVGTGYANAVGANNNSAASATGNAALLGAQNTNNLIGSGFNALGQFYGNRNSSYQQYGPTPADRVPY